MSFVLLRLSAGRKRLIMKGQEKLELKKKGELFLSIQSDSKLLMFHDFEYGVFY